MGAFDASRSFVCLLALVVIGTKGGNDVALLDAIKLSIVWFVVESLKRRAVMRERVVRSVEQIFVVPVRSASSVVRTSKAKHTVFHDQLLEIDLVLAMRANCTATLVEVRLIKFLAQIKVDGGSKPGTLWRPAKPASPTNGDSHSDRAGSTSIARASNPDQGLQRFLALPSRWPH